MAAPDAASSISVAVRVRPFTLKEAAQLKKCDDSTIFLGDGSLAAAPTQRPGKGIHHVIKVVDDRCLVFDPPEEGLAKPRPGAHTMGKRCKDQTFGFDRVFDENATQDDVYQHTTKGLLDSVLDGYNATVFAYGATGCGKTHTITGTEKQPGIIFLTMQELFEKISEHADEKRTEVSLSYLEIYNETIRDLLQPGPAGQGGKQGLMLREDANQTVSVAGLSAHHPKTVGEVMEMIVTGNALRTISPTEANATSSRSHAVLQINVAMKDRNADVNEPHTMATLSIIDLAGSERASVTKNRGDRLLEGANINKSLLALGSCINALCDSRRNSHIPYRNSKLTRLLKFSLGGNCKTVMIVCVSPSSAHFDETQNTLRYANRAKNIQTKVTRNVYNVNRHVKDFLIKIDEQMALINELRAQQKNSEGAAFKKFQRQTEKRESITREGISRIRAAYASSEGERKEKMSAMKTLRQIERRIFLLDTWMVAFESVCENRDGETDMPENIQTMKKTAMGMKVEFENSRYILHQKIQRNNWERSIDSALKNSVDSILSSDGVADGSEVASLDREVELLKLKAQREELRAITEFDREGDGGVTQVLLSAQLDIVASLNDVLAMSAADAAIHAKLVLQRLFKAASTSAGHIIKPDGSLKIQHHFPPTKRGTPKKSRPVVNPYVEPVSIEAPAPAQVPAPVKAERPAYTAPVAPIMVPPPMAAPPTRVLGSPLKASPRRQKAVGLGKKVGGVSFTPNKKCPKKRGVKWRDDTDSGELVEFEKTPIKLNWTPESGSSDSTMIVPPVARSLVGGGNVEDVFMNNSDGSSPLPSAPTMSGAACRPGSNRFQAGFLSKKSDNNGSPNTSLSLTSLSLSDDDSPLRSMDPSKASNRQSTDSMASSTGAESRWSVDENGTTISDVESAAIKAALSNQRRNRVGSGTSAHDLAVRSAHRRRSPTAASRTTSIEGSPISGEGAMFTAGQARRMRVGAAAEQFQPGISVLSPRSNSVLKQHRGERIGTAEPRRATVATGGMSAIQAMKAGVRVGSGEGHRRGESVSGGKGTWRGA